MQHYDKNSKTLISIKKKDLIDPETGAIEQFDEIKKLHYGSDSFWKIFLMDFLAILGVFDSKQVDVFIFIIKNTNPTNNLFIGTYQDISKGAHVSSATIAKIMKKLQEHNFIKKERHSVWRVNPCVIMKGDPKNKKIILSYYNGNTPLNKDLPERKKAQENQDEPGNLFEQSEQ